MTTGKVCLVGAGPGDPGLLTVKGLERIRAADCVLHDSLVPDRVLAEVRAGCEVIHVGHRAGDRSISQEEIHRLMIQRAKEGRNVVRLKGGDPFVFGRGGEECEALAEAGVSFEVVPGVTSAIAAPAYAGIPLTHRDLASGAAFLTGHRGEGGIEGSGDGDAADDRGSASRVDTLVFLMGVRNLTTITARLVRTGRAPETPAAVIQWGTRPEQRTVTGTLADIAERVREAGLGPPALVVVGEVVKLRDRLRWFESRPLFGRRIVVTRTAEQAGDLTHRLEDLGAEVIEAPTIRIQDPEDWGPVDEAIRGIGGFDWVVFTSSNAVEKFLGRVWLTGMDSRALRGARICAVGPATVSRLEAFGLRADLRPERNVAEGLIETFGGQNLRGKRVLIPRAAVAREILPEALEGMGAAVTEVKVYRTVPPETRLDALRVRLAQGEIDLVTFTSSSTVTNFLEMLREGKEKALPESLLSRIRGASFGPISSRTARRHGIAVVTEADPGDITVPGLVSAISRYFQGLQPRREEEACKT